MAARRLVTGLKAGAPTKHDDVSKLRAARRGPDNRGMTRRTLPVAALLFAAILCFAAKEYVAPRAFPAKTYPARDAHDDEKVAIAADPYDLPDKTAIFTLPYREKGYLPVYLIITNDGDQPINVANIKVQLQTASRTKIQAASQDDLYRRFSRIKRRGDEPRTNPLPLPRRGGSDAGLPKGGAQEIQNAMFQARAVEPHSTQAGFLFFDVEGESQPLAGAHLYITGVRDGNGNELMFFDIPMEKYLGYKPGSSGN
ncbi:MAG: hypothetical protein ACR2IF_15965 [Terriglobales bacterium]